MADLAELPDPQRPAHHACDLDGTLAHSDPDAEFDPAFIGEPIPAMVKRVKDWLAKGDQVTIFTARVCPGLDDGRDTAQIERTIRHWCKKHIGQPLPVTALKQPAFSHFWDDRATKVERNTGRVSGE